MKNILTALLITCGFAAMGQVNAPPPPPPAPPEISPEVFKVVEQMPRFPGCEDMGIKDQREIETCAKELMSAYIKENLVYPADAKAQKVEGMSVVRFTVMKDGTLGDIKLLRDPGAGTGQAALDVIHKMNNENIKWIPGKQRGRKVLVQYTLPVRFNL